MGVARASYSCCLLVSPSVVRAGLDRPSSGPHACMTAFTAHGYYWLTCLCLHDSAYTIYTRRLFVFDSKSRLTLTWRSTISFFFPSPYFSAMTLTSPFSLSCPPFLTPKFEWAGPAGMLGTDWQARPLFQQCGPLDHHPASDALSKARKSP